MLKINKTVLMLCLVLSGALCYANGVAKTENEKKSDGLIVVIKEESSHGGLDKSNTINPLLNGHVLSIEFTENIGRVAVEVTTPSGSLVDGTTTITPTGIQIYIANTGDYVVNFTLPNGDEYYGEFSITD